METAGDADGIMTATDLKSQASFSQSSSCMHFAFVRLSVRGLPASQGQENTWRVHKSSKRFAWVHLENKNAHLERVLWVFEQTRN